MITVNTIQYSEIERIGFDLPLEDNIRVSLFDFSPLPRVNKKRLDVEYKAADANISAAFTQNITVVDNDSNTYQMTLSSSFTNSNSNTFMVYFED